MVDEKRGGAGRYAGPCRVNAEAIDGSRIGFSIECDGAHGTASDYSLGRRTQWLIRRQGKRGTGYRQYPNEYLYRVLDLYELPDSRAAVAKAKT